MEKTDAYCKLLDDNLPSIWQVRAYWRDIVSECSILNKNSNDILEWFITGKLLGGIHFFLYRRLRDGRLMRFNLGNGNYLNHGLCSRKFLDLFNDKSEILLITSGK